MEDNHNYVLENGLVSGNCQLELKIAAYFSRDPYLLKAIREGKDMHKLGAVAYLQKDYDAITKEDRDLSKTLGFLLLYLGTVHKMVKVTQGKVKDEEGNIIKGQALKKACQQMHDNWYTMMSSMIDWRDTTIQKAHKYEAVFNAFGRRRIMKDINSDDQKIRSMWERIAVNTPIQSTAVDIALYSMQKIHTLFQSHDGYMIMHIHYSIVDEVREDQIDEFIAKKEAIM